MIEFYNDWKDLIKKQNGRFSYIYIIFSGIVVFLTGLLTLTTFEYIDCTSLTVWSVNFWDSLFQSNLTDYYAYMQQNIRGAVHTWGFGSWLMILPWAIWNFPLWVTHPIDGNYIVTDPYGIYWSKLFLFVVLFIGAFYVYKMVKTVSEDSRTALIAFLFMLISPEVMMSVGVAGQDEIVYLTFFLIAFYYWRERKTLAFLIWSTFSITACPIMLLFYMVLVAIDYKNIVKIAGLSLMTMIPTIVFDFFYRGDGNYTVWKASTEEMLTNIFGYTTIPTAIGAVSIAAVLLVVVYMYCYFIKIEQNKRFQYATFGLSLISVIFCVGMNSFYYRAFLYTPFLILLGTTGRKEIVKSNITLFTILSAVSSFVTLGMNEPLNMNTMYTTKNNLIMKICELTGSDRYNNFSSVHSKLFERFSIFTSLAGIISAVTISIMLLLLWLNRPKAKESIKFELTYKQSFLLYIAVMPAYLLIFYVLLFLYL